MPKGKLTEKDRDAILEEISRLDLEYSIEMSTKPFARDPSKLESIGQAIGLLNAMLEEGGFVIEPMEPDENPGW